MGSLSDARKASREQNVPLVVHIILEGEEQNDAYRDSLLPHKELVALSQNAVIVVANNGEHDPDMVKETVEGRVIKRQVCSKYPWFSQCDDHRRTWDAVYAEYADAEGEMRCPQTVINLPDGEPSWHFNTGNPPEAKMLVAELKKAQKKAGPGLTSAQLTQVKSLVKDARRGMDGKLWGDAWRAWQAVLEIIEVGKYGDEASKSLREVEAAMVKELEEVTARLVPGTAGAAYGELVGLTKEWIGSEMEGRARLAMKRAEKDKTIKAEVTEKKLELEAEEIWEEAQGLLREGEEKKAHKLLKKLLKKKLGGTPAAQRVRERFPELV